MFADLVGSSELAEYIELDQYSAIVEAFHAAATEIAEATWRDEACQLTESPESGSASSDPVRHLDKHAVSPRGDEVCVIISRVSESYSESDLRALREAPYGAWVNRSVLAAVKLSLALKTAWFLSKYNVERRIGTGRLPLGLAIGIHLGSVAFIGARDGTEAQASDFIGYEINLAKRIEGAARESRYTSIMVTPQIHFVARQVLPGMIFETHPQIQLKGILRPPQISEVMEILDFEDYLLKTWRPTLPPGADATRLVDALGVIVASHAYDPGFRFLTAMALEYCNQPQNAKRVAADGLLRGLCDHAERCYNQGATNDCYDTLVEGYARLKGYPPVETLLAKCATALRKPAASYYMRSASRSSECFVRGRWGMEEPLSR